MTEFIKSAIEIAGSQKKLADACGVSQVAVSKWFRGGDIRAEHAIAVEKATDGKVTREQLRPDIFRDSAA